MEQEEKIRDLDHLVEMLDRRGVNASGERYHFLKFESEIAEGEDIGLPIYDCPPTQDTKHQFHWHYPREFIPDGCVEYDRSKSGKWMLFYPVSEIDEKWEMAKNLFDTGELRGVRGMKVSTAKYNPRTTYDGDMAVLIMYCGPWTDEPLMREIGNNLALKTEYENKRGSMLYKTNDQTRRGTRATGQVVNHVYRIQVPKPNEGTASSAMLELRLSKEKRDCGQWHRKPDGVEYDPSTGGKWMLLYPASEVDDRWHLVKSLFDAGELHGVGELQVYTAKGYAGHPDSGVINVYCGPYDDEELMMRIGKNLAKKMQYKNRNDFMLYKTEGQQMKQGRVMGQGRNHLYEISLPWRY